MKVEAKPISVRLFVQNIYLICSVRLYSGATVSFSARRSLENLSCVKAV